MAGTLTISTLSDGTYTTSATNLVRGPCVAWVNFNGNGVSTIRASYNISSVTRNGTGNYTIVMATAQVDGNYAVCGTASTNSAQNQTECLTSFTNTSGNTYVAGTTTTFGVISSNLSASVQDVWAVSVAVFR